MLESLVVTVAPTVEPLTLSEIKQYSRITISDDDTLINSLITQARQDVEKRTRRALGTQTIQAVFKRDDGQFWGDFLELPAPPLQSVSEVEYRDTVWDTWLTFDAANYVVDAGREPGRIYLKNIPTGTNYLRLSYLAGYNPVPAGLKKTLLALVLFWYDNRDKPMPASLEAELRDHKIWLV
jgi:uncharacterized phiE125 gp8 family phage protein